ncbi:hypothetical protein Tco_1016299 [Tanacetum coccineum]|uniref:Nucleotidyltransferase n=1 Tax=Tanacetum coccineum TaxID=301880 RepID=A0ABQ5FP98_9ASTR
MLTMEAMLENFINEDKREQEKMEIFINEFRTTNELLLKEQNNLLSELKIKVYELGRVMSDVMVSRHEIKGVTIRGGKMTSKATYDKFTQDSDIDVAIRRFDSVDTAYSEEQKTVGADTIKNEHLYSATTNEIDEKKPKLKGLPSHLEIIFSW